MLRDRCQRPAYPSPSHRPGRCANVPADIAPLLTSLVHSGAGSQNSRRVRHLFKDWTVEMADPLPKLSAVRRRYRMMLHCPCTASGELVWEEDDTAEMTELPINPAVVALTGPFVVIKDIEVACRQCQSGKR